MAIIKPSYEELWIENEKLKRQLADKISTENLLLESERKFRTFFDIMPVQATITKAKDGTIVDINRYNEIVNNIKKENIIGKTVLTKS